MRGRRSRNGKTAASGERRSRKEDEGEWDKGRDRDGPLTRKGAGKHVTFVLYKRLFRTITTRVEGHQRGLDIFEYRHSQ